MVKKKVLIIDDEVDFCLLMQFYLTKKNCEVSITHTLKEGLGVIKNKTQDIVFLDNNLPDGLGWPEANRILEAMPEVNLYLISANKQQYNTDVSNSHLHFVEKPLSISQIDDCLKSANSTATI